MKREYLKGLKAGIPICLGYLAVSFTFGLVAVNGGMPIWMAFVISITNLTSAGQFACTKLILASAGFFEIALTTLVINLRYSVMSLTLSQKLKEGTGRLHRLLFSFGITDDTFVVASMEKAPLTSGYMYGLITLPIFGWSFGTFLGGSISTLLTKTMQNAMGIALYGMFIGLTIPAARKSVKVLLVMLLAIAISCVIKFVPIFGSISSGFCVIISAIIASTIGAFFGEAPQEGGEQHG